MASAAPRTMFEKIWARHVVTEGPGGHVLLYVGRPLPRAGSPIRGMAMDERMAVGNMSIEAGARTGMVAPDETTFAWLEGRPFAPRGEAWARALADWTTVPSDPGARFDREVALAAGDVAPTVTWGTSPQDALPITGRGPDPAAAGAPGEHGAGARVHGAPAGHAARRDRRGPRVHRLLHEQPARGPARGRAGRAGAPCGGARVGRARLGARLAGGAGPGGG